MKYVLICILLFLSLFSINSQDAIEITIGSTTPIKESSKIMKYYFKYSPKEEDAYIKVQTIPTSPLNPAKFYLSTDENPSEESNELRSERIGTNTYYIPYLFFRDNEKVYLTVICQDNCDASLSLTETRIRQLVPGEELTLNGNNPSENIEYFDFFKEEASTHSKLLIYFYWHSIPDLFLNSVDMTYYKGEDTNEYFPITTANGYAFNVDISDINTNESIPTIRVKLSIAVDYRFTIGARYLDNDNIVYPYDTNYVFLDKDVSDEICYKFDNTLLPNKKVNINLGYVTNSFLFVKKSSSNEETLIIDYPTFITLNTNDYIDTNEKFCFRLNNSTQLISFYQIVYQDDLISYDKYFTPALQGTIQKRQLSYDNIINLHYYRDSSIDYDLNVHITDIKGKAVLYGYLCTDSGKTIPECYLDKESFITAGKEEKLLYSDNFNDDYTMFSQTVRQIFVIKCESVNKGECEYLLDISLIDFLGPDEETNLLPNNDYISHGNKITFNYKFPDGVNKALLSVSSISDTCTIRFQASEPKIPHKDVRGKVIYELNRAVDLEETTFYLERNGSDFQFENGVCILNIDEGKENKILRSNIENIEHISKNDNTKTYTLQRRELNENDYVILVESLNCALNIKFYDVSETNVKHKQFVISKDDLLSKELEYDIDISVYSYDVDSDNDNYCTVIISGTDNADGLIVTEGNQRNILLNEKIKSFSFILPYIELEKTPFFYVDLKKPVNVIYTIESNTYSDIIYKSQYFNLDKELKDNCKTSYCNIIVKIENKDNIDSPIKFWYKKIEGFQPVYLEKNSLYSSTGFTAKKQYFYTDIAQNESGEVVIDFKKGGGNFFISLVSKDSFESNYNWNHRVHLPISKEDNNIAIDIMKTRAILTEEDTKKCTKGCELYITIEDTEQMKKDYTDNSLTSYFSIQINNKENIVKVPQEEYVLGYLDNVNEFKYYTMTINANTAKAIIAFKTEFAEMYIKEGNEKPTLDYYDIKLVDVNRLYQLDANVFNKESLYGLTLTIGVIATKPFAKEYSSYQYRLIPTYGDNQIIKLTSEQEEFCETYKEDDSCYFIVHINRHEQKKKIYIYAYVEENPTFPLKLYGNLVLQDQIDSNEKYSSIIDLFPTQDSYQYISGKKTYLSITKDDIQEKKDLYVLVNIISPYAQQMRVLASTHPNLDKVYFNSRNYKLFFAYHDLSPDAGITTNLYADTSKSKVSLKLLSGKSELYTSYIDDQGQSPERQVISGYGYSINKESKITQFKFRHEDPSDDFIVGKLSEMNGLLDQLREGDNIIDNEGTPFPNAVYFPFPKNKMNVTIWYYVVETSPYHPIEIDDFESSAYIIKDSFLNKYMIDPSIEIEGEKLDVIFNEGNKTFMVNYYNTNMSLHYGDYIFITMKKSESNTKEYIKTQTNYFSFIDTNFKLIEQNYYNYNQLSQERRIHCYRIIRDIEDNHIFEVELSENPKRKDEPKIKLKHSFERYQDYPKFITDKQITIKSEKQIDGKLVIVFEVDPSIFDPIIFSITPEEEGVSIPNPLRYVFKYRTVQTYDELISYDFNRDIIAQGKGDKAIITMTEIFGGKKEEFKSGLFFIVVYNKDDVRSYDDIYSIYDYDNELWISEAQIEATFDESPRAIQITIPNTEKSKYVNVIGHFKYITGEPIILSYRPIEIKVSEKAKSDKYIEGTLTDTNKVSYIIGKKDSNDKYIQFEIASEVIEDEKDYISFSIEEYSNTPTYKNYTTDIKYNYIQGKRQYIVKYEGDNDLLLSLYKESENNKINYLFKYSSAKEEADFPIYTKFDSKVSVIRIDDLISISFIDLEKSQAISLSDIEYTLLLYGKEYINTNTIEANSNKIIKQETLKPSSPGEELSTDIDYDDRKDIYVVVIASFTINDIEYKVSYNVGKPEKHEIKTMKESVYYDMELSLGGYTEIKTKTVYRDTEIYYVEIIKENSLQNETNELSFSIEELSGVPKYKNGTGLTILSEKEEKSKITITFKYNTTKQFILLSFRLLNTNNDINSVGPHILCKYKTMQENEKPKTYQFNSEISSSILFGKLTVRFREIFKDKTEADNTTYIVELYDKEGIKNITELQSAYPSTKALMDIKYISNNSNNKVEVSFSSIPSQKFIINVIAYFKTKEGGEEMYISYGISEPSSYTILIIGILVVIALIILGGIAFIIKRCISKRKIDQDILSLESGKLNIGELERRTASLLD